MTTDKKDDGGPAFACAAENRHQQGMSLRDWFAGLALQGFCADGEWNTSKPETRAVMAIQAYALADAMLAERNKP